MNHRFPRHSLPLQRNPSDRTAYFVILRGEGTTGRVTDDKLSLGGTSIMLTLTPH
jgi:hypothetical protein